MPSTSGPEHAKYQWLDGWVADLGGAITLTVTGISSPQEFLVLVGARQRPDQHPTALRGVAALADESMGDDVLVGVMPAPGRSGWVLGAESPANVSYEKAGELSVPGGTTAAFHCTEESGASFTWAETGITLAEFSLTDGDLIDGSDPDRLWQTMRAAALDKDDTTRPCATAAALLEHITGVSITREILEEGEFTAGAVPFPYW